KHRRQLRGLRKSAIRACLYLEQLGVGSLGRDQFIVRPGLCDPSVVCDQAPARPLPATGNQVGADINAAINILWRRPSANNAKPIDHPHQTHAGYSWASPYAT
ncbi:MAG: hypothetical protein ACRDZ8_12185, partial [Acidimicrobiales bacterium]